jgi:HlyD family secretion protein
MKTRLRFIPIVLIIIVAVLGVYWFTQRAAAQDQGLKASGTIEATDITLAPEIGGRVVDVLAAEGDLVQADQPIVQLDDTLLQAQLKQVGASIQAAQAQQRAVQAQQQAAQANYDLLKSGPIAEQIQAAQEAVQTAEANATGAQAQLAQMLAGPRAAEIAAAEAAVAKAASDVTFAQQAYDGVVEGRATAKSYGVPGGGLGQMEEKMRAQLQAIQANNDVAVKRLAQLKQGATKDELNQARARVAAAEAQQAMAQAQLEQVQKGTRAEQLAVAQAQIDAAKAQVEGAGAQIEAAKAQAAVLQTQIDKLTLRAPLSGVVLRRAIEPGEMALPGASLLTIGDTDHLYLTVYIPENRYGEITLGQAAQVNVDSFPGQAFTAKVTRIADRAEFTPRNVQTAEGRATTVFAVKLALENADGNLKPGMPADVYFEE